MADIVDCLGWRGNFNSIFIGGGGAALKYVFLNFSFERLYPILGGENIPVMLVSRNRIFGPQIRTDSIENLIIDASTVALHVLDGLYNLLHEAFGVVHCDISPGNIMHNPVCDRFKLNDFGSSLPFTESTITPREHIGTSYFVAPESKQTGQFSKASDIYWA